MKRMVNVLFAGVLAMTVLSVAKRKKDILCMEKYRMLKMEWCI